MSVGDNYGDDTNDVDVVEFRKYCPCKDVIVKGNYYRPGDSYIGESTTIRNNSKLDNPTTVLHCCTMSLSGIGVPRCKDDQQRNPNIDNKDHLVGQLTTTTGSFKPL